ncbi:unnamed protein product, partial [Rotaria magnacalcarata]
MFWPIASKLTELWRKQSSVILYGPPVRMSPIPKSNLKRIRDILLADENGINSDLNDNQGSDSDSDSDFLATESDDTSNSEHISEESDLSNSDFEHGDVVTVSQPETLKKNGVIWSIHPSLEQSRTAATNVMKK